jgi:hypothetical protein
MKKPSAIGKIPLTAVAVLVTAVFAMPTAAYAAPVVPTPPASDSADVIVTPMAIMPKQVETAAGASAQAICTAYAYGDYPHISTSNPGTPRAVQAHGGWNRGDCAATRADVTTQIDRKNPIGLFQAVGAQGRGVLPSQADFGLPSSNRVTARYQCNGSAKAPFRAWTSIDMVGIDDISSRVYTPATGDIICG